MRKLWPYSKSVTKQAVKTLIPLQEIWDRLIVPLLLIFSVSIFFVSQAEHGFFEDLIHQGAATRQAEGEPEILVVLVDQKTRALLGQNSDSTQSLACLTQRIMAGFPKAIALDYYFSGEASGSAIEKCDTVSSFRDLGDQPIITASILRESTGKLIEVPPSSNIVPHHSTSWGHASIEVLNRNEVARKVRLLVHAGDSQGPIPSLALSTWLAASKSEIPTQMKPRDYVSLCLSDSGDDSECQLIRRLKKNERLNYVRSRTSIDVRSAESFFSGLCSRERNFEKYCAPEIEGKIVLIGSSAPNSYDQFVTPLDTPPPVLRFIAPSSFNEKTPGVVVHAVALDNLIHGRFINHASFKNQLSIGLLGFALILISFYVGIQGGKRLFKGALISGTVGFVFLLAAIGFLIAGFIVPYWIGVDLLQDKHEIIFISVIWPIYLILITGLIFFMRLRARAVILANNAFIWRHVGPRARENPAVRKFYEDIIKRSRSGTERRGIYIEFTFSAPSVDNRFYPVQAYLLQSELLELGDQIVASGSEASVIPFVDNWSTNTLRMYVLCQETPSDEMSRLINEYIRSLDIDNTGCLRRFPTLGVVSVDAHDALISVVDIPGAIEENILTLSARQQRMEEPAGLCGQRNANGLKA